MVLLWLRGTDLDESNLKVVQWVGRRAQSPTAPEHSILSKSDQLREPEPDPLEYSSRIPMDARAESLWTLEPNPRGHSDRIPSDTRTESPWTFESDPLRYSSRIPVDARAESPL